MKRARGPLGWFPGTTQTGQDDIHDKDFERYPKLLLFFCICHCFYALSITIRKIFNTKRVQVLIWEQERVMIMMVEGRWGEGGSCGLPSAIGRPWDTALKRHGKQRGFLWARWEVFGKNGKQRAERKTVGTWEVPSGTCIHETPVVLWHLVAHLENLTQADVSEERLSADRLWGRRSQSELCGWWEAGRS